jgi:tetratricopeptide (TPR) repeat protein
MSDTTGARNDVIEAREVPLSHLARKETSGWASRLDWRTTTLVAVVAIILIFALVWQPDVTPTAVPSAPPDASDPVPTNARSDDDSLPPFAELSKERAREVAQRELGQFVEQQIKLEDTMQVGSWGAGSLDAAKALAIEGDAEFVAERFASAIEKYQAASTALEELVAEGDTRFAEHLAGGLRGIEELDPDQAVSELTNALTIKPNDKDAIAAMARAEQLPEIITMLRTAKNHELGERYEEALAVYRDIAKLDADTTGLEALRNAALAGVQGNNLNSYLSQGFAALDREDFAAARSSFNQALSLDPGNDVAEGGLQQVQKRNDLTVIATHRRDAEAAIEAEAWQDAIQAYQKILDLDGNIQFALSGRRLAGAHERVHRLLTRIKTEPQKLSSEKLYLDAQVILREARDLTKKGPKLDGLVVEVDELLTLYRDPVEVVLTSDNATDIIVSNVGKLGAFERKTLTLRPGQYTIRGSQDGCRDIYLSVDVIPGIDPIDLSCQENVSRN